MIQPLPLLAILHLDVPHRRYETATATRQDGEDAHFMGFKKRKDESNATPRCPLSSSFISMKWRDLLVDGVGALQVVLLRTKYSTYSRFIAYEFVRCLLTLYDTASRSVE